VDEGGLEQIVSSIRSKIEQAGGSFIAEGAPAQIKLAYPMEAREGDKRVEHDRAYFGWVKFEAPTTIAKTLESELQADAKILRSIVFQTVREETRAKMKAPTLREVKRTDTIKATPRAAEEAAPVSEEDLDKALQDITTE
jgi:ribosomal protein S6